MNVPTAYTEKYVGWWLAFLLPLLLYLPLPVLLWYLHKRLILYPPGGSDLTNVIRVLGVCFKRGGLQKFGRKAFSTLLVPPSSPNRTTQLRYRGTINSSTTSAVPSRPVVSSASSQFKTSTAIVSVVLRTRVPNNVIRNFNSLSIIVRAPILNYGLYPLPRRRGIHFGAIAHITFGILLAAYGGAGYTMLNYYAYKDGHCGKYGGSSTCVGADGISLVSDSGGWLFLTLSVVSPSYSSTSPLTESLIPVHQRIREDSSPPSISRPKRSPTLSALLFVCLVRDPYLTWDFG